jgi:hypothetical protein
MLWKSQADDKSQSVKSWPITCHLRHGSGREAMFSKIKQVVNVALEGARLQ